MTRVPTKRLLLATVGLLASAAFAQADNVDYGALVRQHFSAEPKTPDEAAQKLDQAAELRSMALALAAYGQANNDPLALLTAASLAAKVPTEAWEGVAASEGKAPPLNAGRPLTKPEDMIAAARAMIGNDETLVTLAAQVEKQTTEQVAQYATQKSNQYGSVMPGSLTDYVYAGNYLIYQHDYFANEWGYVEIFGDNAYADLDLGIFDSNGNAICMSASYGSYEACEWVAGYSGTHVIIVDNPSGNDSWFTLTTN